MPTNICGRSRKSVGFFLAYGHLVYALRQNKPNLGYLLLLLYRITKFRNTEIDKWQRKIQVTTGAAALKGKLHAFNQVS